MEMASLREVLEVSEKDLILTEMNPTTTSPTINVGSKKVPRRPTFGLAFTESEFEELQEKIARKRRNREKDTGGGLKMFPWLGTDEYSSGLELDRAAKDIQIKIDAEQIKVRQSLADPELDDRVFIFSLDLDAVSNLASRYPRIDLRSFTIIKRRLTSDKNAIVNLLQEKVESWWRDMVMERLRRDSVELRETLENVRRHIEGIFEDSSAILDDSDSSYDTDSDGSDDDEEDNNESEPNENQSGSRRGFNWLTILGTEEERFGN